MSVDILSPVDPTAITLRAPANEKDPVAGLANPIASNAASQTPEDRQIETILRQNELITRLQEARDLNRQRARRLIATLRQLQGLAESNQNVDQFIERLLDREAKQQDDVVKAHEITAERTQLAAMRKLSQWNAKRQQNTQFRRNFVQVTVSQGAIAPLALLAGTGLLAVSRSAWPSDIYAAILCYSIAVVWGGRYLSAVLAPLRHRFSWRSERPAADSGLPPEPASTPAAEPIEFPTGCGDFRPSEKHTVAELLAELRLAAVEETPDN